MTINPGVELVIEDEQAETKRWFSHWRFHWDPVIVQAAMSLAHVKVPDGETSTGHQKFRLYSDDEIIERIFGLYGRILSESVKRGWAVEIPSYEELKKKTTSSMGFS